MQNTNNFFSCIKGVIPTRIVVMTRFLFLFFNKNVTIDIIGVL